MPTIDPDRIVVLVEDRRHALVRIGVSRWSELREVIQRVGPDDQRRFNDIDTQVSRARPTETVSSDDDTTETP